MGLFHQGLPRWLVDWAQRLNCFTSAVETGTYLGDSALVLSKAFGSCTTIEKDPYLASRATDRLRSLDPRIVVVEGSSREALLAICGDLGGPAFFWLDGHWSGGETAGKDDPCPVMAEIDAIRRGPSSAEHLIVVDDARLFGFPHDLDPTMEHYPSLRQVLAALEVDGHRTFVVDDVIVAVPGRHAASFMGLVTSSEIRQATPLFTAWSGVRRVVQARALAERTSRRLRNARLR